MDDTRDTVALIHREIRYVRSHRAPGSDLGYAVAGFSLMALVVTASVMIGVMIG